MLRKRLSICYDILHFFTWPLGLFMLLRLQEQNLQLKYLKGDDHGKQLVVVVPFATDLNRLEDNYKHWQRPLTNPFIKHNIDLVLYYHLELQENTDIGRRVINLRDHIRAMNCFRQIYILSARLGKWEDRYPIGPSKMFFKLLLETPLMIDHGYSFMFWMEPDVLPIRPGWLDQLYRAATFTSPNWWMIGSVRRDKFRENPEYSYARTHLNGCALYRLDDPEFRSYAEAVSDDFDQRLKRYMRSFDVALHMFKEDILPFSERSRLYHRFIYSDFIHNVYRTPTNVSEVLSESPNTYFLHGRHLLI